MCFSEITSGNTFLNNSRFLNWFFFSSLFYSVCIKQKSYFRIGLLGKAIPETPVTPAPRPINPQHIHNAENLYNLLNLDLNELVPVERPSDSVVLGC